MAPIFMELAERVGHVNSADVVVKCLFRTWLDGNPLREPLRIPDLYTKPPLPAIDI